MYKLTIPIIDQNTQWETIECESEEEMIDTIFDSRVASFVFEEEEDGVCHDTRWYCERCGSDHIGSEVCECNILWKNRLIK